MTDEAESSSVTYGWTYDVFLSFRGEDTRSGFTGHLYNSLVDRGIKVFIDDNSLRKGGKITPDLSKAIQKSRIAIIVFSKNYAFSTFCLNELAEIIECFKGEGRLVLPVFHYVDPSDVRHQRGSYGEALDQHQQKLKDEKKVQRWRLALSEAANLSGWHLKLGNGYEYEFIGKITAEVSIKINRAPLHVTDYPVGLVPRVQEVISLLNPWSSEEVHMVGICGFGGIGKSTIARALYNSIAAHFEDLCFLSNVREISNKQGLSHLQETLLSELVKEKDLKLSYVHRGISIIKQRLRRKKVLLILDDVDKLEQLQALAGRCDWFGSGSRIIITTRNKDLLASHEVERVYNVKELNNEEALQLFSWNAFKKSKVDFSYMNISNRAIHYSSGLPLALEVIGSNLYGKTVDEWISALDKYERIPNQEVLEVLKLSYDALEEEEKEIFLDLACFFKDDHLEYVIEMLQKVRGIQPKYAIRVLVDRSLVKTKDKKITMHDLLQDMGKEIVRLESPKEPGNRSRLWFDEDILHVLQENTGTDKTEIIILDLCKDKEVRWSGKAFKKMKKLRMLIIKNASFSRGPKYLPSSLRVLEWNEYPLNFLPSGFNPMKLVDLGLSNNGCELLEPLTKNFKSLSRMSFRNCKFLRQVPDLSGVPNLTELWLDDCPRLVEIPDSVGLLDKLRELSVLRCSKLKTLPHGIKWKSLEHLHVSGCSSLQSFPKVLVKMEKLTELHLKGTAVEELPSSICNLMGLQILNVEECERLKQLPTSICMLPKLQRLTANDSCEMRDLEMSEGGEQACLDWSIVSSEQELSFLKCNLTDDSVALCLSFFPNMIRLDLSFNNFTTLPASIRDCYLLRELLVDDCKHLQHIEGMPPNLEKFSAQNCTLLTWLSSSILLNQVFQQPGKRNFILPGERIPEWFDHYSEGNSVLSFWGREELPAIVLCILVRAVDNKDHLPDSSLSMYISVTSTEFSFDLVSGLKVLIDHVYLYDLGSIIPEIPKVDVDEWYHVEVSIMQHPDSLTKAVEINSAIHIYKQAINSMVNIQFKKLKPSKRTYHDFCNSSDDSEPDFYPLLEIQQQQHLTLNSVTPVRFGTVSKHNEKDLKVGIDDIKWLRQEPLDYMNCDSDSMNSVWETENIIINLDRANIDHEAQDQPECHLKSNFPVTRCSLSMDEREKKPEHQFSVSDLGMITGDQLECQFTSSSGTTNIQAPSPTAPSNELASENELNNELASLEERKKEIGEQINTIEVHVSVCQASKVMATKRKREIIEEGKDTKSSKRRVEGTSAKLDT